MGIDIREGIELWQPRVFNEWQAVRPGSYYGGAGSNVQNISSNRLYATYLAIPRAVTVDRIGCGHQRGGGGRQPAHGHLS